MSFLRKIKMLLPHRQLKIRKERRIQRATVDKALRLIREKSGDHPGQRGLFIDCGFNTRSVFDQYYTALADRYDFVGFEIQQELFDQALKMLPHYSRGQPDFIHAAVSDHDGSLRYFEPKSWGLNYKGGATIVSEKDDRPSSEVAQEIPCIDFSRFLAEKARGNPFTVVKMDIEGAEYQVMEKVIEDGNLEKIDMLFIEFHYQYLRNTEESNWQERHENLLRHLNESKTQYFDWI